MAEERDGKHEAQQPEFVRGLEAAARSGGVKPPEQGNTATPETKPDSGDLERDQAKAAEILKRNSETDTGSKA